MMIKFLDLLNWWRREIDACYADQPRHPVFVALHRTIRQFDIPREPRLNHRAEVRAGVMADEALALLREFFGAKRQRQ